VQDQVFVYEPFPGCVNDLTLSFHSDSEKVSKCTVKNVIQSAH